MVGHVEAEHLLFEGQAGGLVELDVGHLGPLVERRALGALPEQRHDPHVVFLPTCHRVVDDLLVGVQQALARVAKGVEGPCFNQGLDGPLVEHRCVAPFGKVVEVGERTVGRPFGLD